MKIGILGAADIAYRRFLPALKKCGALEYAGVASREPSKAKKFCEAYDGCAYASYDALLEDSGIDAVYIPLPPALHDEWGRRALAAGKHVLMEKPFTTNVEATSALISMAEEKNLVVHENYMFLYHSQLAKVKALIDAGELGKIRLYRMAFGFPKRRADDFRYSKALGGGALLDCGGYPVRLALELLGNSARIMQAKLCRPAEYEVDLYGNAVLENDAGECAQISFGMDNAYQCQLEIWGSKATLIAPRVFTAGADDPPELILRSSYQEKRIPLSKDDHFLHSIETFLGEIHDPNARRRERVSISNQSRLMEALRNKAN